ncbi:MAG: GNAT family N-acetyltransferase [Anaerolineae bacterium]
MEFGRPGHRDCPSDTRPKIAKKLKRDPELFLVAESDDGRVIGVIMGAWDGRRGWIHHLAVDDAYRNRGVGTALVNAVEERLRAMGCLKVNLLVRRENQAAIRLYRRLGYDDMVTIMAMGKEL